MVFLVVVTVASAASGPAGVAESVQADRRPAAAEPTRATSEGLSKSWTRERLPGADPSEVEAPLLLPGRAAPDLVFPVVGEHTLTRSFGDPRSGGRRSHEGVDILADKGAPVVAVADGVVRWLQNESGGRCCAVSLVHDGGWRTRYLHLDNDTPGTDDGRRVGIAPGIEPGVRVRQGDLLGWVGDSGNAEATVPHLHFELRLADGTPLDPFRRLEGAPFPDPDKLQ